MTNAYSLGFNASHQLRKVEDLVNETSEKLYSFLYIGNKSKLPGYITSYFHTGIFAEGYVNAQEYFDGVTNESCPDVIFVDCPLNETDLQNFCVYLKKKNLFGNVVIIYNDECLDSSKVRLFKKNEWIDDAMSFNSLNVNYSTKISFLKKIKSRQWNFNVNIEGVPNKKRNRKTEFLLKRSIDVILASSVLVALSPLFLVVAVMIKMESKGPIFYTSKRAGRGFKVFRFYKFRTMEVDADKKIKDLIHLNQYGNSQETKFLKIKNDPRVTSIGKVLRKTSIDEIPQLLNVLKGDMSLVGNRPLPLYEASELTTNESVERFMAPAGMTGLWQIKKRGQDKMSVEERIQLDIVYARNANLMYDLWIMANTPGALLQKSEV